MNICCFIKLGLGDLKKEFRLKYFQPECPRPGNWSGSSSYHAVKIDVKRIIKLKISVLLSPSTVRTYVLVCVPVQGGILQDEPVLFPFLGEISFGILFLPEPALAVTVAQVLAGNASPAHAGEGTPWEHHGVRGGKCSIFNSKPSKPDPLQTRDEQFPNSTVPCNFGFAVNTK